MNLTKGLGKDPEVMGPTRRGKERESSVNDGENENETFQVYPKKNTSLYPTKNTSLCSTRNVNINDKEGVPHDNGISILTDQRRTVISESIIQWRNHEKRLVDKITSVSP